jgi:uracil-DNA glycosylase family 4
MRAGLVCHQHGITGYGNPDEGVMLVGISPGREDVVQGKPFVGQSGRLLQAILEAVGWPRENVYCTNLVCYPCDSPTAAEISMCLPRLLAEINQFKPKLIILFGHIVSAALTGSDRLNRGAVRWHPEFNAYVMTTFHPASLLRGDSKLFNDVVRDLAKIPIVVKWPQDDTYNKVEYTVVDTVDEAQALLNSFSGQLISLDVETDSAEEDKLDVFRDGIVCLAVSNGKHSWVFPNSVAQGLVWPTDINWLFHNGLFDSQSVRQNYGVQLKITEDTMLMSYSLDERAGYHGLKSLSQEYCAAEAYAVDMKRYRKAHVSPPLEELYEYNAKDAAYTHRLFYILYLLQKLDNVRGFYEKLLVPAANTFSVVQRRGVFIDQAKLRELALDWLPKHLAMEDTLVQAAQSYGFQGEINLNSPKQLSHLLYDILRLPGGPSTAKDILETLDHPFVRQLQEFRHLDHMVGTYVLGIKDDIKRDGRVHADVLLHGTVTGRLTYHDPPLQIIPKVYTLGDDYGRLRSIFSASDDEHLILEVDYGRVEIWCAYFESGDQQLYNDLTSGDYHATSASNILKKPLAEVTKKDRFTSKFVTFGIMYGRGAVSLANGELQCSVQEAERYLANWLERYPVYAAWREARRKEAINSGELVSKTGRKRRFGMIRGSDAHRALNQALNFPLQSLGSDITLSSIIELHPLLEALDSHICFSVHDSILIEVSKKHQKEVIETVKEIMTKPRFPGLLGVDIDLAIGSNWGEVVEC